jgi:hypothetical protein
MSLDAPMKLEVFDQADSVATYPTTAFLKNDVRLRFFCRFCGMNPKNAGLRLQEAPSFRSVRSRQRMPDDFESTPPG